MQDAHADSTSPGQKGRATAVSDWLNIGLVVIAVIIGELNFLIHADRNAGSLIIVVGFGASAAARNDCDRINFERPLAAAVGH